VVAEARRREATLIVAFRVAVPARDALDVFAAAGARADRFHFEAPARGVAIATAGEVECVVASGSERFRDAACAARTLFASLRLEDAEKPRARGASRPVEAGPLLVGGFAFADAASARGAFVGFPALAFRLPRVAFVCRGGEAWCTLAARAAPADDPGEIAARLEADLASAMATVPRAAVLATAAARFGAVADRSPEDYRRGVARALAAIASGEIEKVVMARACAVTRPAGFDAVHVLASLRAAHPRCVAFAVDAGDACFVGATPERLLRREGLRIETSALAGSAPRGRTPEEDARLAEALRESKKEQAEHAIVRRDTRMFDDPLQFYSRAVGAGIIIAVLVCLGAALLAYFKPLGKRGDDSLLVDRTTNQLYVVLPDSGQLRPVYNLTSARLILGNNGRPVAVKSQELDRMPKGQPLGIPGAPYATPVSASPETQWSLCDTVVKPESVAPTVETSVLITPLALDASVGALRPEQGMLVSYKGQDWLVTATGRHAIDLSDRAVTSAVGIPVTAKSTPISEGLFNALPNAGPWSLPAIPAAGAPNTVGLPPELVIGAVFKTVTDSGGQDDEQNYVVLPDGVAKVNGTTAAALRASNSFGLISPPSVEASDVAKIPEQVFVSPLPDQPMDIRLRHDAPTLCWSWQREPGDQSPRQTVFSGRHLPIPASKMNAGIRQITGAATVYIDGGQFIRLQSPDPRYGESLYYIDPQGIRYGLPNQDTANVLGLASPQTAPWQVVSLLVDGPVLSKQAALLEHDTLPADPDPRKVAGGTVGQPEAAPDGATTPPGAATPLPMPAPGAPLR
jgi:type VII secretion protein EccB